jgi:hypothetical protein
MANFLLRRTEQVRALNRQDLVVQVAQTLKQMVEKQTSGESERIFGDQLMGRITNFYNAHLGGG